MSDHVNLNYGFHAEPARPAHTVARLAGIQRGGSGRFDLVVAYPDGSTRVVRPTLSRAKAEDAAEKINRALQAWVDALDEQRREHERRRARRPEGAFRS